MHHCNSLSRYKLGSYAEIQIIFFLSWRTYVKHLCVYNYIIYSVQYLVWLEVRGEDSIN